MYKANFYRDQSKYYLNDKLLFIVKTKVSLCGLSSVTKIYKEEKSVFCFYEKAITVLFWNLKIITQGLEKQVYLEKRGFKYFMVVDNKRLLIGFNPNPFSNRICKCYLDSVHVGSITRVKGEASFIFNFYENTELEFYFLILFAMCSIGITSD